MNIITRVGLFIIYSVVAVALIWIFAGSGHGTFVPVAIFCSWGIPLARLIWPNINGMVFFSAGYYLALFILAIWLGPRIKHDFPIITVLIHGLGCAVALSLAKPLANPQPNIAISLLTSATVVVIYLWTDWLLTKKARG